MYDTVSAVLGEVPDEVMRSRYWTDQGERTDLQSGEVHRRRMLNAGGLMLTLHEGGAQGPALKVERSLPKAYRGENIHDLIGPAVAVACAIVDAEIGAELHYEGLPSVWEWSPTKVDYPWTDDLGDEGMVLRTLDKYAGIELPYKGRPVAGQSHSVTWSAGAVKLKAYGKYEETGRDPRAYGLLRHEAGVFRTRAFRALLGVGSQDVVTLGQVLTPDIHGMVRSRFESRLRGDLMTAKEIGDMQLWAEMHALFGLRRTVTLLGWAAVWAVNGVESRSDMLSVGLGNVATRYRVLADYRRLRDVLIAKGYTLSEIGTEAADLEGMVRQASRVAA